MVINSMPRISAHPVSRQGVPMRTRTAAMGLAVIATATLLASLITLMLGSWRAGITLISIAAVVGPLAGMLAARDTTRIHRNRR
jgi:hypothetical protein